MKKFTLKKPVVLKSNQSAATYPPTCGCDCKVTAGGGGGY